MEQKLQNESQVLAVFCFEGRYKHNFEFATAAEDALLSNVSIAAA